MGRARALSKTKNSGWSTGACPGSSGICRRSAPRADTEKREPCVSILSGPELASDPRATKLPVRKSDRGPHILDTARHEKKGMQSRITEKKITASGRPRGVPAYLQTRGHRRFNCAGSSALASYTLSQRTADISAIMLPSHLWNHRPCCQRRSPPSSWTSSRQSGCPCRTCYQPSTRPVPDTVKDLCQDFLHNLVASAAPPQQHCLVGLGPRLKNLSFWPMAMRQAWPSL